MARMLGSSRTVGWKLCRCRHCKGGDKAGVLSRHRVLKRIARGREERLWRREQT